MTTATAWPFVFTDDRFLTPDEEGQLEALFSGLFPRDPARGIPGATDAGAAGFVSRLLALDAGVYDEIPAWRPLYRTGLAALDAYSRTTHDRGLGELTADEMTALLKALDAGQLPGLPPELSQVTLWKTLWRHCLQGAFADPRWGGNRDGVMWRWLGCHGAPEEVL